MEDRTDELVQGVVFRRVPDKPTYFDHDSGRPERVAFEPREQDNHGLSVDLDLREAEAALALPKHEGFGLVALDIAEIRRVTDGTAWVRKPLPGRSHTRIENCESVDVQLILTTIADVRKPPRRR